MPHSSCWSSPVAVGVLVLLAGTAWGQAGESVTSQQSAPHQAAMISCGARHTPPPAPAAWTQLPSDDPRRVALERHLEEAIFRSLPTEHQEMLVTLAGRGRLRSAGVSACFAPGTDPAIINSFNLLMSMQQPLFQPGPRWQATALNGAGPFDLNTPTTLTWGILAEGTSIPGAVGEPTAPNNIRAWMDGIYGSQATWLPLFQSIFDRWGQLAGLTYVFEPNDDGADFPNAPGESGVRADVRIGAKPIDGNSNILAYNYFPQSGDMVLDSNDNFYNNTNANSLRLRNILSHEHGHGLGMGHVCPVSATKLMEPFLATAFDGPRHDDIRHAQFFYGDRAEPNPSTSEFFNAGTLGASPIILGSVPTPPAPADPLTPTPFASTLSLNGSGDVDVYRFGLTSSSAFSVTLTPVGLSYDDSAQACNDQPGACCFGNVTTGRMLGAITFEVLNSAGVVIATPTIVPNAGEPSTASVFLITPPNQFFVRVAAAAGSAFDRPQSYTLTVNRLSEPLLASPASALPAVLPPGEAASFDVRFASASQSLDTSSPRVFWRVGDTGPFSSAPMGLQSMGIYRAALPGFPCGQRVQYYVQATSTTGTTITLPANAPTTTFAAEVGTLQTAFSDDFETDRGWTTFPTEPTIAGLWVRAEPVPTAAQPGPSSILWPGTTVFVTANAPLGAGVGLQDVDGTPVVLTSPNVNIAGLRDVRVSYDRWYSNNVGTTAAYGDVLAIEASANNGGTWTPADNVGPGSASDPNVQGGWIRNAGFAPLSILPGATSVRVRLTASDVGAGSIIEAAIDNFAIRGVGCGPTCDTLDFNQDGDFPTPLDLEDFIAANAGSICSTCSTDLDFNNDGDFPTPLDIEAFISVNAGGPCL